MTVENEYLTEQFDLIICNNEDIWRNVEWCAEAMVKRDKRGDINLKSYLVDTSIVSKIITAAKKEFLKYEDDPVSITRAQMKLLKETVVDIIWQEYEETKNFENSKNS